MRILLVIGTRPEAIKLAPLGHVPRRRPEVSIRICPTSQHRELLSQGRVDFGITADHDLDIMTADQNVNDVAARVASLPPILEEFAPDWVMVQGDTTTAMAASLAAFQAHRKVAHVEAGLRTGDLSPPWPDSAPWLDSVRIGERLLAEG